jgi:hypothetical protein
MEKERTSLRQMLEQGLQETITPFIAKEHIQRTQTTADKTAGCINHTQHQFCIHDAFVVSAYLRELYRLGLWPLVIQQMKITDVLDKLSAFDGKELAPSFGFRVFGRDHYCMACTFNPGLLIDLLMKRVMAEAGGACLDCVRKGDAEDVECRIKHD